MGSKTGQIHGVDHRPNGTDPLPGVIVFDYANVGDWLYVKAESYSSGLYDSQGIQFVASAGILLGTDEEANQGPIYLYATESQIELTSGARIASENDVDVIAGEDKQIYLRTDDGDAYLILDGSSPFAYLYSGDSLTLEAAGDLIATAADDLTVTAVDLLTAGGSQVKVLATADPGDFPISLGANSAQVLAGDASNQGTVLLSAYDGGLDIAALGVGRIHLGSPGNDFDGVVAAVDTGSSTAKFAVATNGGTSLFEVFGDGYIYAHLPSSAGPTGSLYVSSGFVKVA